MTSLALELDDQETPAAEGDPRDLVSRTAALMGGRVGIHVVPAEGWSPDAAGTAADILLRRIGAWADRLTRFAPASDLSRLNSDSRREVPVGPTLAEVLDWGREAEGLTGGIVDVGLLDARLAAEGMPGGSAGPTAARPSPRLPRGPGRSIGARAARPSTVRSGSGSTSTASARGGWPIGRWPGSTAIALPQSMPTATSRSGWRPGCDGPSGSRTHVSTATISRRCSSTPASAVTGASTDGSASPRPARASTAGIETGSRPII